MSRGIALCVVMIAATAGPTVAAAGTDWAELSYARASFVSGDVGGSCEGGAYVWPPEGGPKQTLQGVRAALYSFTTRWNETVYRPNAPDPLVLRDDFAQERKELGPVVGDLDLVPQPAGRTRVFRAGWPGAIIGRSLEPLIFSFDASRLDGGPPELSPQRAYYHVRSYDQPGSPTMEYWGGIEGWSRSVRIEGTTWLSKAAAYYLDGTTVEWADQRVHFSGETRFENLLAPNDAIQVRRAEHVYGLLLVDDHSAQLAGGTVYCGPMDLHIQGDLVVTEAVGNASVDGHDLTFARNELSLHGTFRLEERMGQDHRRAGRVSEAVIDARATGDFAVSSDFGRAVGDGAPAGLLSGAAAVAVAGLLSVFARVLFVLYGKFRGDSVLDHPTRKLLNHAVMATPGLTATQLARNIGRPRTLVEHHLRLMGKHGAVDVCVDGARRRFVPHGAAARFKTRVHEVTQLVKTTWPGSLARRSEVASLVCSRLGRSRAQAYRDVARAIREGDLRVVEPGRVMVTS